MLVEFDGLSLESLPGVVMIPRATSVALVDRVAVHVGSSAAVVADVGTGSGAMAIAIAMRAPRATVWATDVDSHAVGLARGNAARAGVADRVRPTHEAVQTTCRGDNGCAGAQIQMIRIGQKYPHAGSAEFLG